VFADPDSPPCDVLAPCLEQLHQRHKRVSIVVISRGDPALTRAWIAEHGLTMPVALQRRWEVSRAYGLLATPMAYLLDDRGAVVDGAAVGVDAIVALASSQGGAHAA